MFDSFNKMFRKVPAGWCRLSLTGGIAVKTSTGYKTYDVATGNLVNCSDFVLDVGDEMFFCIPTNTLFKGDIILVNNKPAAVIKVENNGGKATYYKLGNTQEITNFTLSKSTSCKITVFTYFDGNNDGILSEEILGVNREEKWSDLWYIFKPYGYDITLAEMSPELRDNREISEHNHSAMIDFSNWFEKDEK